MLLPHLLQKSSAWHAHRLRVFTVSNDSSSSSSSSARNHQGGARGASSGGGSTKLAQSELKMVRLLTKLRIQAQVTAVDASSCAEDDDIANMGNEGSDHSENEKERKFRRLGRLMRKHSSRASGTDLVFVTLPLPDAVESMAPKQYMRWLELISSSGGGGGSDGGEKESGSAGRMPPTVIMRGNNQDVLTLYS